MQCTVLQTSDFVPRYYPREKLNLETVEVCKRHLEFGMQNNLLIYAYSHHFLCQIQEKIILIFHISHHRWPCLLFMSIWFGLTVIKYLSVDRWGCQTIRTYFDLHMSKGILHSGIYCQTGEQAVYMS